MKVTVNMRAQLRVNTELNVLFQVPASLFMRIQRTRKENDLDVYVELLQ